MYQFVWHDFCDWYLEMAKIPLYRAGDEAARRQTQETLVTVLETTLRLLHPFMPFITEEIWQRLPEHGESIMRAPYPKVARGHWDAAAETVGFIEGKLARADFVERAPAEIVEKERQRLAEQRELRDKLAASLAWVSDRV